MFESIFYQKKCLNYIRTGELNKLLCLKLKTTNNN